MNDKEVIVSVIIPAYNVEAYISQCVKSVLCQRVDTNLFEVIVIDDGSTDNTGEQLQILLSDHKNDPSLTILSQKNEGVSSARNRGIKSAKGQYVFFLDGDDQLLEDSFEHVFPLLRSYKPEVARFEIIVDLKEVKGIPIKEYRSFRGSGFDYYSKFRELGNIKDSSCATFYLRDLLNEYQIAFNPKAKYLEDGEFVGKVLSVTQYCFASLKPIYLRTMRDGSVTRSNVKYRRDYVEGVFQSVLELLAFSRRFTHSVNGQLVLKQYVVKFVALVLQLTADKHKIQTYISYRKRLNDIGLPKLDDQNLVMNFGELARVYNMGGFAFYAHHWIHKAKKFFIAKKSLRSRLNTN